jgi:uncharacterized protein
MNPVLEQHMEELADLCRRYGVERLEAFGSSVREDFDPSSSDFDFVVRFAPPHGEGYADRYLNFVEALERLLGRPVDLLTERSVRNPIFEQVIAADRRLVYGG